MKKIFFFLSAIVCAISLNAESVTYKVTVPEGTNTCYIAGKCTGWNHTEMTKVDDTHYTITLETTEQDGYKYCSGPSWDYVEKAADGSEMSDRNYSENDVVAKWASVYGQGNGGGDTPDPSVTEYWYFDENNTGWGTIDDKWKMTVSGDIAYVKVPAGQANKFKIFPCNPKVDDKVLANDDNIAEGALAGDIALSKDTEEWKNILIGETSSEYFVVLYLPNTATNSSSKYLVAAKSQLHTGISNAEVQTNFTKIIRNGQVLIVRDGKTFDMMGQQVL